MLTTVLRAALPALCLLLAGLADALDLRRWDADVQLVRNQVLSAIAERERVPDDPVGWSLCLTSWPSWIEPPRRGVFRPFPGDP